MTDQQYTPTTEEVLATLRSNYQVVMTERQEDDTDRLVEYGAHFDSVIATVEAAAEQRGAVRGWDEAIDYAWDDSSINQADAARAKSKNPYRADQEGTQDG